MVWLNTRYNKTLNIEIIELNRNCHWGWISVAQNETTSTKIVELIIIRYEYRHEQYEYVWYIEYIWK